MTEAILAILGTVAAIVLLWMQRSTKTKLDRARDVVDRNRSRAGRMRLLLEERNFEELEKELERQDRDLAVLIGLPRKTNPPR